MLFGCDSNPVDDDHDGDHADAHGFSLLVGQAEVYRVLEGAVTCDADPCGIDVGVGQTVVVETGFLAEDGDEVHAEDLGAEYTLAGETADTGVARFTRTAADGRFGFRIEGVAAGTTRLQLRLLHNDHADLTTPPLTDADAIIVRVQ